MGEGSRANEGFKGEYCEAAWFIGIGIGIGIGAEFPEGAAELMAVELSGTQFG